MRAAVATPSTPSRWAFSTLGCPGATLPQILSTAEAHQCRGVELRVDDEEFVTPRTSADRLEDIRASFDEARIEVLAVTSRLQLCSVDTDPDELARFVDVASLLGARGVRVFMGDGDGDGDGARARTAGELRAIALIDGARAHLARTGMRLLVETHDSRSTGARMSSFFNELVVRDLASYCGVIWDVAHSWKCGESPSETLQGVLPWLDYIQLKDVRSAVEPSPVLPGSGAYPIGELEAAVRVSEWDGWFSLEWERRWYPRLPNLDVALRAAASWAPNLIAFPPLRRAPGDS